MNRLNEIIQQFQDTDEEGRLELLLEYSDNMPRLPDDIRAGLKIQEFRVHECQTPVYLSVIEKNKILNIFADVPRESPTVRGIVSILIKAFTGSERNEIVSIPLDLIRRLGLSDKIGMLRIYGINAIIQRLRQQALVDIQRGKIQSKM